MRVGELAGWVDGRTRPAVQAGGPAPGFKPGRHGARPRYSGRLQTAWNSSHYLAQRKHPEESDVEAGLRM